MPIFASTCLPMAMRAVRTAVELDNNGKVQDAYCGYLSSMLYIINNLKDDVCSQGFAEICNDDTFKLLKLVEHCHGRASDLVSSFQKIEQKKDLGANALPPYQKSETILRKRSHERATDLKDDAVNKPSGTTAATTATATTGESGKIERLINSLPTPPTRKNSWNSTSQRKVSSIDGLQNRQMFQAYRRRKSLPQRKYSANYNLGLFRKSVEDMAIEKARRKILNKKLQERRERLKLKAEERIASKTGSRATDAAYEKEIYTKILEFEQETTWPQKLRERLSKDPENTSLIEEIVIRVLSAKEHPLGQQMAEMQYTLYRDISLLVANFSCPVFSELTKDPRLEDVDQSIGDVDEKEGDQQKLGTVKDHNVKDEHRSIYEDYDGDVRVPLLVITGDKEFTGIETGLDSTSFVEAKSSDSTISNKDFICKEENDFTGDSSQNTNLSQKVRKSDVSQKTNLGDQDSQESIDFPESAEKSSANLLRTSVEAFESAYNDFEQFMMESLDSDDFELLPDKNLVAEDSTRMEREKELSKFLLEDIVDDNEIPKGLYKKHLKSRDETTDNSEANGCDRREEKGKMLSLDVETNSCVSDVNHENLKDYEYRDYLGENKIYDNSTTSKTDKVVSAEADENPAADKDFEINEFKKVIAKGEQQETEECQVKANAEFETERTDMKFFTGDHFEKPPCSCDLDDDDKTTHKTLINVANEPSIEFSNEKTNGLKQEEISTEDSTTLALEKSGTHIKLDGMSVSPTGMSDAKHSKEGNEKGKDRQGNLNEDMTNAVVDDIDDNVRESNSDIDEFLAEERYADDIACELKGMKKEEIDKNEPQQEELEEGETEIEEGRKEESGTEEPCTEEFKTGEVGKDEFEWKESEQGNGGSDIVNSNDLKTIGTKNDDEIENDKNKDREQGEKYSEDEIITENESEVENQSEADKCDGVKQQTCCQDSTVVSEEYRIYLNDQVGYDESKRKLEKIVKEIHSSLDKLHSLLIVAYEELDLPIGRDQAYAAVEFLFFKPLWQWVNLAFRRVNVKKEIALYEVIKKRKTCVPMDFFVREKFALLDVESNDTSYPYKTAVDELRKITTYSSLLDKLECIVSTTKLVCENVKEYWSQKGNSTPPTVGCDDLLPILTYIIVKSALPQLVSECHAMEEFIHESYLLGEEGYCLTTLSTAIMYVLNLQSGEMPGKSFI